MMTTTFRAVHINLNIMSHLKEDLGLVQRCGTQGISALSCHKSDCPKDELAWPPLQENHGKQDDKLSVGQNQLVM